MPDSDSAIVIELIHAFRYSKIMFVAVSLGSSICSETVHGRHTTWPGRLARMPMLLNGCLMPAWGCGCCAKTTVSMPMSLLRKLISAATAIQHGRATFFTRIGRSIRYGESLKTLCVMAPTGGSRYLVSQVLFLITSSKPKQLSVISLPECTASDCSAHLGSSRLLI